MRRLRATIAVVVCTFTAASVAAYQVYNAVCAQESAAQRALLSHARFAAWTFAREANEELERAARRVLAPTVALAADRGSGIGAVGARGGGYPGCAPLCLRGGAGRSLHVCGRSRRAARWLSERSVTKCPRPRASTSGAA